MPNFDAIITAGAELVIWEDPPLVVSDVIIEPARTNPEPAYPHKYWRVWQNTLVTVQATVDVVGSGMVQGPLDVDLDGHLFTAFFAQAQWPPPSISQAAGHSSSASFTPSRVGFYSFVFLRAQGGRLFVPFWVEELS